MSDELQQALQELSEAVNSCCDTLDRMQELLDDMIDKARRRYEQPELDTTQTR